MFKKQLRPLVRLLQAKTLTLKHLAALHTNIWEPVGLKLMQHAATMFNKSHHALAAWCEMVRALRRTCLAPASSMVEGSTHCNKGVHLQRYASDLESQQVDHLNDSHVTSKWNDKEKRIKRQSSTKERQGAVFSHVTSHIKLPTKNMCVVP